MSAGNKIEGELTLCSLSCCAPNHHLGVFGEIADPELACLRLVRRVVEIGDEGPNVLIGEIIVRRILREVGHLPFPPFCFQRCACISTGDVHDDGRKLRQRAKCCLGVNEMESNQRDGMSCYYCGMCPSATDITSCTHHLGNIGRVPPTPK